MSNCNCINLNKNCKEYSFNYENILFPSKNDCLKAFNDLIENKYTRKMIEPAFKNLIDAFKK